MLVSQAKKEIKEAVYHAGAYIGLGKAEMAVKTINKIFGETIDDMRAAAPENQKHIQDFLSAYCFGDFYTRKALDLKERELLTFCIITTQDGCEPQVGAHVGGNVAVGNGKDILLDALTLCMPYIGFPRTLNALGVINKIIEE